jgi:hypothetical protein
MEESFTSSQRQRRRQIRRELDKIMSARRERSTSPPYRGQRYLPTWTRSSRGERLSQVRLASSSTVAMRAPCWYGSHRHNTEEPGMSVGGIDGGIGAAHAVHADVKY